tara:strand:+ start:82 stop:594 length:513 start_codon:yes stop_codon:yes gene_type:complete
MYILSIGSNLPSTFGDRFENIKLSVAFLENYKIKIVKKSNFYETPSYPDIKNPKFINIAVEISTSLPPEDLASVIIFIEEKLERVRRNKNEPRTCDIDIVDYNGQILNFSYNNQSFSVPHEKLIFRNFVLYPLKEIAPKWVHPITQESIDVLINNLSSNDKKSILMVKKY